MLRNQRSVPKNWWIVLPTAVILMAALLLTNTSQAAPAVEAQPLLTKLLFQEQEVLCQDCHAEEYAEWEGTPHANAAMDPAFQDQFLKNHEPEACLPCHTTGFDTSTGEFHAEGVTCEACHGTYKEGHPKAETMMLPMESTTCRVCHLSTFDQWEVSAHAAKDIDCYDCHQSHSQGLRLGSEEKLCGACHSDAQTELAHSIHGISGVDCVSCHMSPQSQVKTDTVGMETVSSNHSFIIASDVCMRCHGTSIHTEAEPGQAVVAPQPSEQTAREAELQSLRVQELEQQLNDAQKRTNDLRNLAVVSMGLTLGVGGMMGLLVGVVVAAFVSRGKKS